MKKFRISAFACLLLILSAQQAHAQNAYAASDLSVGDSISVDDVWYIVGKNLVTNGDFDEDPADNNNYIVGWTGGDYNQMTTTYWNWNESGGYDDGPYISATASKGASSAYSMGQRWSIEADSKYYFSFWLSGVTGEAQYYVISITNVESSTGGQNEYTSYAEANGGTALMLLGQNGEATEDPLGFVNYSEDGDWVNTAITFDSEECTYLQFSARWLNTGNGFDGFGLYKLYDPETTTRYELLEIEATSLQDEAYDLLNELYDANALVFAEILEVYTDDGYFDAEGDEEAMQAYIDQMEAYLLEGEQVIEQITVLDALLEEAESKLDLGYAGASDLESVIDQATTFADDGYGDLEAISEMIDTLEDAITAYLFSQEATADNPADYTFLISCPYFLGDNDLVSITYLDDNAGIASIEYTNGDNYSNGSAPSDASSDGWYTGTSGGDQRLNYTVGRVCWNAWRTGDYTVAIYQDLTDLPNGYYTISAEMVTQTTCITDQHLLAKGSTSTVSPVLTYDNMTDGTSGEWEWLTTEKALVLNGNLTIGAEGGQLYDEDGNLAYPENYSTYRGGWFVITNWRLLYYGEASAEDVQSFYDDVVAEANAYLDSVYYAADKAQLASYIATYSSATTADEMATAMDSLNYAIELAQASYEMYLSISQGTLLELQNAIADGSYSENQIAVAQTAVDILLALEAADDATYTNMEDYADILDYYLDSYLPALAEAEALTISDETAAAALAGTIASQVSALSTLTDLPSTDELDEYIDALDYAMTLAQGQDLLASGATDLTDLIVNPTVEGSSASATGWTVYYNQSYFTSTGQSYIGDSSDRYFNSYNSTAGAMYLTAFQTLIIPNGTYELSAMMRASGTVGEEGVYLFAADGEVTEETTTDEDGSEEDVYYLADDVTAVFAAAHIAATDSFYVDSSIEKGTSYGYFGASYGPIWVEAYDAVDAGTQTSAQDAIAAANGGIGYGWFYVTLQIDVTSRQLTLGITNDSVFTAGYYDTDGVACVPSSGGWYSADNFTLTLISSDDDYNIASGVESVEATEECTTFTGIYTLDGRRITSLDDAPVGVYIVRYANNKTLKILKR